MAAPQEAILDAPAEYAASVWERLTDENGKLHPWMEKVVSPHLEKVLVRGHNITKEAASAIVQATFEATSSALQEDPIEGE